jgi:hypothetical protein
MDKVRNPSNSVRYLLSGGVQLMQDFEHWVMGVHEEVTHVKAVFAIQMDAVSP